MASTIIIAMNAEFSKNSPELPSRPELEERIASLLILLEFHRQKDIAFDILPLARNAAVEAVEFNECKDFAEFNLYLQKYSTDIAMFALPFDALSDDDVGYYNPATNENGENLPVKYGLVFGIRTDSTENPIETLKEILLHEYGVDEKTNQEKLRFAGVLID